MKQSHIIIILVLIILLIIGFYKKTNEKLQNSNNKVIFFYTKWCKHSQSFMPIWDKISNINRMNNFQYLKIDCDTAEGTKMAIDFKITQLPTIYIVKNGKRIIYTGDSNGTELNAFLEKHEA